MSSEKQKDVKPSPEGKAENNESKENEKPQLTERQLKRLARRKNKDRKRELKHILLGSYFTLEDGRMASGGGKWMSPLGLGEGAGSTIFLGVKAKRYRYNTRLKSNRQALFAVSKAMSNIGRAIALDCAPDALACYVKSLVYRPVILVFEEVTLEDNSTYLELNAYSGRSPLAFISIRRTVSKFDKELPDTISRV